MADKLTETLKAMRDGAIKGHFWIGSTSTGRHTIDRAATLPEIISLALLALEQDAKASENPPTVTLADLEGIDLLAGRSVSEHLALMWGDSDG